MNQGRDLESTSETITNRAVSECNGRLVVPGTVLLSFKLSIGKVGIARRPMYTNEAIAHLPAIDGGRLESDYLYRALENTDLAGRVDRAAMGATLNKEKLKRITIPLPPVEEQRRIAAILDQADELRAKRRTSLALLDSLTESIFLDMFGDPATNARGCPRWRLSDVVSTTSGGTPSRERADYFGGGVPWIKSGELDRAVDGNTEETLTELGLAQSAAKVMPPGTVLMAMYGATAGQIALLRTEAATNQAVCCISVGETVSPVYLEHCLRTLVPTMLVKRVGGAQPNLSQGLIRALDVPIPSTEAQREFAGRVGSVERDAAQVRTAKAKLDSLFASLQQRAFAGQL